MLLEGSCHCGAVRFSVEAPHPYPFALLLLDLPQDRRAGGYAINLGGDAATLKVEGAEHVRSTVRGWRRSGEAPEQAERKFCGELRLGRSGSGIRRWPELLHPHASAIDSALPVPPEHTHLMLDSKAGWVEPWVRPATERSAAIPTRASPRGTIGSGWRAETGQ